MLRDADACTEYMYMCVYIRKSWVLELYLAMALAKFRSAKGASHHQATARLLVSRVNRIYFVFCIMAMFVFKIYYCI